MLLPRSLATSTDGPGAEKTGTARYLFSVAVTAAGTPPAAAEPDDAAVLAVLAVLAGLDVLDGLDVLLHPATTTDSAANPTTDALLNEDSFTAHLRVRQMPAKSRVWTDTPPLSNMPRSTPP
jgi:hypothetical protein